MTRLLGTRDFALVDSRTNSPNGQLLLKYTKGSRSLTTQIDDPRLPRARNVGSVLYAWITPTSATTSTLNLLGKPTLSGQAPCTPDSPGLPCQVVEVDPDFLTTHMSGRFEVDVHGVLNQAFALLKAGRVAACE